MNPIRISSKILKAKGKIFSSGKAVRDPSFNIQPLAYWREIDLEKKDQIALWPVLFEVSNIELVHAVQTIGASLHSVARYLTYRPYLSRSIQ